MGRSDAARRAVPPDVDRTFGLLVHDLSRLIKRRFERQARHIGLPLTRQQGAVVLYIARREGVSQAEVATWLGIEPIALVRMLDKLHEEGLVERRAHPTDRRVRTLWLTAAARPIVSQILAINQAIRDEAFAGLPPRAREVVIELLGTIRDNLTVQEDGTGEAAAWGREDGAAGEPPSPGPAGAAFLVQAARKPPST